MTDEQLALAAQRGDSAATRTLLEKYKNAVRGCARSFFLEGGETEDLVQEGMIGLYLTVTDFKEGGMSFKNFAYLCIRRRIMSAVKSAARKKHSPLNDGVPFPEGEGKDIASPEDPESSLIAGEEAEEFWQKVRSSLSASEYEALLLYMEGLSVADIAARRAVSVKSADNAIQRAKKKIEGIERARFRRADTPAKENRAKKR